MKKQIRNLEVLMLVELGNGSRGNDRKELRVKTRGVWSQVIGYR